MAAGWSVENDAHRGRHLVARQRFAAGHTILSQEPYAAVLYDDQQELLCDHTMRPAPDLKRCANCKFVRYGCLMLCLVSRLQNQNCRIWNDHKLTAM